MDGFGWCLQLVVQALHQLILGSGGDYLHASLHVPRHRNLWSSIFRRPRCPGPARSKLGGGRRLWRDCWELRELGLGQSHRVQAPGEGTWSVVGLRLDAETGLGGGTTVARLLAGLPEVLLPERRVKC